MKLSSNKNIHRATFLCLVLVWFPVHANDSALDTSFSGDGYLHTDFGLDDNDQLYSLLVQPDGAIITLGFTQGIAPDTADPYVKTTMARYLPSGDFDTSFGENGKLTLAFSEFGLTVPATLAMALLPQGKILIAGSLTDGSAINSKGLGETRILLARLNPDGNLDTSFSNNGFITHAIPANKPFPIIDIQVQPDGKYLVAGTSLSGLRPISKIFVARFNVNGELDTNFNSKGYFLSSGISNYNVNDIALQTNGEILVAGDSDASYSIPYDQRLVIVNLLPDGSLDNTFSQDGFFTFDILDRSGTTETVKKLLTLPDSSLIAIGSICCLKDALPVIMKLDNNGNMITDFGDNGIAKINGLNSAETFTGILLPDGKLLVAGSTILNISRKPYIARLNSNGTLDLSFNETGHKIYSHIVPPAGNAYFARSHKLPGGGVVFGGSYEADQGTAMDFLVARINGKTYDLQPKNFSFADATGSELNTLVTSGITTITEVSTNVAIPVSIDNGEYKINNTPWTSRPGHVFSGNQIAVRHISANESTAETQTTLTVGGLFSTTNKDIQLGQPKSATFTSTTKPAPNNDNTNNQPTPVSGGGGSLSLLTLIALLGVLWYRMISCRFPGEETPYLLTDNR